jgi:hypothetical protein
MQSATPGGTTTREAGAAQTSAAATPPVGVTPCDDIRLPDRGVGEADFAVNAAEGLLGIHFSDTRGGEYRNISYTVRYLEDPSCRNTSEVALLIDRVDPPGWFPAASQCQALAPNELPNGTRPRDARPYQDEGAETFVNAWGQGNDQVTVGRGREVLKHLGDDGLGFDRTGGEPVVGKDGIRRWVTAIGDPPLGQITYKYVVDGCPYVLWTESGMAWTDALTYASRLATTRPSWQLSQHRPLPPRKRSWSR